MKKVILQPAFYVLGVSLSLYTFDLMDAKKQSIKIHNYYTLLPYWIFIVRPSGLMWNQYINKTLSKDMPPQMRHFKQLFLTSKKALILDLISNHLCYNSLMTFILGGYIFLTKSILDKKPERSFNQSFLPIFPQLIKTRFLFGIVIVFLQYWGLYFSVEKVKDRFTMPDGNKRLLFLKDIILNLIWYGFCINKIHKNY